MADTQPMTAALRAWLERAIAREGGVNKLDEAAGLPRGTVSRWLSTSVTPSADNLRRVAERIGPRYGVDTLRLYIVAGLLPPTATELPRIASAPLNAALLAIQEGRPLEDALAAERAALRAVEPFLPPANPRGTGDRKS